MKILVIEDDDDVRQTLVDTLEINSFEVNWAINGDDGIEKARSNPPDLVVCDVNMPGKDGFEVLDVLRKDAATADIPFIFLTAKVERENIRLGMSLGAEDYITKPFTQNDLLSSINARLSRKSTIETRARKQVQDLADCLTDALPQELLGPLNGILSAAGVLEEASESLDREQIREMSKLIRECAERQQAMVKKFLLFAELELTIHNPAKLDNLRKMRLSSTRDAVSEAASAILERYPSRRKDLDLSVINTAIRVNPEYFITLLCELLDNAFKFSNQGSPVRVETDLDARRNSFVMRIEDVGIGMSAEQLASLQTGIQWDRNIYSQQGIGLGVIIARRIAEAHGGQISFISNPGHGTSVVITLPLAN
jgi:signal transduction histidine kinase